jgi:hypothetical protein
MASERSLPCNDVIQYALTAVGTGYSQCNRLQPIGYRSRIQPSEGGDLTVVFHAIKTSQFNFPEVAYRALNADVTVLLKTCAAKQICKGLHLAADDRACSVLSSSQFQYVPSRKSTSKSLFTDSKPITNIHTFCIPQIQNLVRVKNLVRCGKSHTYTVERGLTS